MTKRLEERATPFRHAEDNLESLRKRSLAAQDLSPRERQVLNFSARSMSIASIAELLGIKRYTVRSIQARIRQKLGVTTRADLLRAATLSQVRWDATPALALYEWTYENLIGARILGAVVQDEDWFGLLLEMQNGENRVAWFVTSLGEEHTTGWIELE